MDLCAFESHSPEENLAIEEALLDSAVEGDGGEVLRLWQPRQVFVVVGYSNPVETEVHMDVCKAQGIQVLRRCSGGGTVVQGPGCLNYALVLNADAHPELAGITTTNRYVMSRQQRALNSILPDGVVVRGHTDLAIGSLKFSGNSQRRKKSFVLFHGSILLNMDLELITALLRMPSRQPDYRANRSHREFLMNFPGGAAEVSYALQREWGVGGEMASLPLEKMRELVRTRYSLPSWNQKF